MNRTSTDELSSRDLLYRSRLGTPWVMLAVVASCVAITLPLFFEPRRYYLTLGIGFCQEDGVVRWWHYLVARFVHGSGCGFPPIWFHLGINVALFVFQGMLVERLLGSGRVALLTFACLAVQVPLGYALAGGRLHGASGMAWSYLLFVFDWLLWARKRSRWRMMKDWVTGVLVLLSAFAVLGLAKHWHLWNLLASVPFYLAWRKALRSKFEALARGEGVDRGPEAWNRLGVAAAGAVLAFNVFFLAAAVSGRIEPASLAADR